MSQPASAGRLPAASRASAHPQICPTHGVDTVWPKRQQHGRRESEVMVAPLARGLAILSTFGPHQAWLGNLEIATATGIPAPTVSRLLKSLVALGYLRHDRLRRRYGLQPAALALGYAAVADADVQRIAGDAMQKFAEATGTYVVLAARDGLDVVILDTCAGSSAVLDLPLLPGVRAQVAYALTGNALIALLPDGELRYLLDALERQTGRDWPALGRRIAGNIAQVRELGFCTLSGAWAPELAVVSAPLPLPGRPPLALTCVGRVVRMAHTRIERELGPRLVAMAQAVRERVEQG